MASNKNSQYTIGKEYLYYIYRFIILPWELEWKNEKFLISEGKLREFCNSNNINLKSFESSQKLENELMKEYEAQEKCSNGIIWIVRRETKPKDILRQLRNCFAHGHFVKRQKNNEPCIVIENMHKGRITAKGYVPLSKLKALMGSLLSCKV